MHTEPYCSEVIYTCSQCTLCDTGISRGTVHDTENLTFSEEFRGCSARNDADFPHGCRRISARVPRIFRADGHESSVRIRFENGGNQKANFVRNNAKRSRNTPQGSFEISL